jgi:hypothetical protein
MKWDYIVRHIHSGDLEPPLNELGADGWELVSCMLPSGSFYFICVLKRPVSDADAERVKPVKPLKVKVVQS